MVPGDTKYTTATCARIQGRARPQIGGLGDDEMSTTVSPCDVIIPPVMVDVVQESSNNMDILMMKTIKICVLGAGAFGTAMAMVSGA